MRNNIQKNIAAKLLVAWHMQHEAKTLPQKRMRKALMEPGLLLPPPIHQCAAAVRDLWR